MALARILPPDVATDAADGSRRAARSKWLLRAIFIAVAMIGANLTHGYLAASDPVGQGVLAVEAWIPAPSLTESVKLFDSGRYRYMLVVGGPIRAGGALHGGPATYDELAVRRLEKLGFDTRKVVRVSVPLEPLGRRTIGSAAAVRQWLNGRGDSVCCVDVFTVGVHARKSQVLFRHELGDRYRVGVVAASEAYLRGRAWFFSARGISTFFRDLAGYVYAKTLVLLDRR